MTILDPQEIDRFSKLLGLLGSDHDGERSAAAAKATAFLGARSMGWPDIGEMLKRPPIIIREPEPVAPSKSHQTDARFCLRCPGITWSARERQFLHDMASRRSRLTEKQENWLDALCDRVTRWNRENANASF